MQAFSSFKSIAIPVDIANCDTDQIIPARFLRLSRDEPDYDKCLFHDLRFLPDGTEKPDFIYNREPYRQGCVIVADINWGCGSSREHAVWALVANGIRAVIAPSFGDIHYNNCMKQGVLPVRLPSEDCDYLRQHCHENPGAELAFDLPNQKVTGPNGQEFAFDIAPFDKHRMLNGLDDIGVTNDFKTEIDAFEDTHRNGDYAWLA